MSGGTKVTSNWADEIEDDEEHVTHHPLPAPQEVLVKDGERRVSELVIDPESGKKKKIIRTFRLEKKLGEGSFNFKVIRLRHDTCQCSG